MPTITKFVFFRQVFVALLILLVVGCKEKKQITRDVTETEACFHVDSNSHEMGDDLKYQKEYTEDFVYFNVGNTPLVINKVMTSCGCVAADYPKEPLMPGNSAVIHVTVTPSMHGYFRHSLSVYTNAKDKLSLLWVTGNVQK